MSRRARAEALDWDDRLKRDRSAATRVAFDQWLAADPAHRREYEQMASLDALLAGSGLRSHQPVPRARRQLWPAMVAAAAAAVILVVALAGSPFVDRAGTPGLVSSAAAQFTRPVRLADGSLMILSADARAMPDIDGDSRAVTLTAGSARILVSAGAARPMTLRAGRITARLSGGVVDLEASNGQGEVTIRQGAASAWTAAASGQPAQPRRVAAGQRFDGASAALRRAAPRRAIAVIEANKLALGDLVRILDGDGGEPPITAAPALLSRRVTGRFDVSEHRLLARRLAAALGLTVQDRGTRIMLAPA